MFSGNTLSQVIPFIIAPVISRIFSPEEFAIQSNFLAIVGLIGVIAAGRYELALVLPKENKKAQQLFIIGGVLTVLISILSLVLYFFQESITELYKDKELSKYLIYIGPAILFMGLYNILFNWMVRYKKFNLVSASRIIQSVTGNLAYAILGYLSFGVAGLIIGWFISQIISTVFLFFPALKFWEKTEKIDFKEIKLTAKEYKDFPLINSIHAFSDIFATQFFIFWLITHEFGMLALGLFSIMNRYLRAPIQLVSGAVSQIFYREASDNYNHNISATAVLRKTFRITLFFALPSMAIVAIFGPTLFAWYLGEQWRVAGEYAQIMTPALFVNFLSSPLSTTPLIYKKQKQAFIISILGYVLSLGVIILFSIFGYPFITALWAYSISLTIYYLVLILWYFKLIRKGNNESIN